MTRNLNNVTADWARKQVTENLTSAHNRQLQTILLAIKTMVDNGKDSSSFNYQEKHVIKTVREELVKRGFKVSAGEYSSHRNEDHYTTIISW